MNESTFPAVWIEVWIARRLASPQLFAGLTTPQDRRQRVRDELVGRGLEDTIAGQRAGETCETWQALFARVYGEPLA